MFASINFVNSHVLCKVPRIKIFKTAIFAIMFFACGGLLSIAQAVVPNDRMISE
jgi:hypothetical protein